MNKARTELIERLRELNERLNDNNMCEAERGNVAAIRRTYAPQMADLILTMHDELEVKNEVLRNCLKLARGMNRGAECELTRNLLKNNISAYLSSSKALDTMKKHITTINNALEGGE